MIFMKIVITNFHQKLRKLSVMYLRKIQMMAKSLEIRRFLNIKVASFTIYDPDSLGVNLGKSQICVGQGIGDSIEVRCGWFISVFGALN